MSGFEEPLPSPAAEKLVLLVDDDASLLDLMEHVVKKDGFRTERASDGAEALRKTQALNPDILVLDMMLPGMGGYEVLRELQAAGCGDIPIIVVTGRQFNEQGIQAIRHEGNVKEFLLKPVRPVTLVGAIHRLLNTQPTGHPGAERGG